MGLIVIGNLPKPPVLARCLGCGVEFYVGQDRMYEQHVVRCSAEREEEMRERSPREMTAHFLGRGDEELEGWVRKHKGLILEGRKQM